MGIRVERAFHPFVPMTFVGFGSIKRCTETSIDRKSGANYRPIDGRLSFFLIVSHDNSLTIQIKNENVRIISRVHSGPRCSSSGIFSVLASGSHSCPRRRREHFRGYANGGIADWSRENSSRESATTVSGYAIGSGSCEQYFVCRGHFGQTARWL
jgi:hypothetical protein